MFPTMCTSEILGQIKNTEIETNTDEISSDATPQIYWNNHNDILVETTDEVKA